MPRKQVSVLGRFLSEGAREHAYIHAHRGVPKLNISYKHVMLSSIRWKSAPRRIIFYKNVHPTWMWSESRGGSAQTL